MATLKPNKTLITSLVIYLLGLSMLFVGAIVAMYLPIWQMSSAT